GHAAERVVARGASTEPAVVPDLAFARFDALAAVDARGGIRVRGTGPGRASLDAAVARVRDAASFAPAVVAPAGWRSSLDRDEHADRVEAVLAMLEAGECYQVNLTRRLTCDDAVDPVALHGALAAAHPAPHLTLLHLPDLDDGIAVVSASPERF